jgi:hypothetical protein
MLQLRPGDLLGRVGQRGQQQPGVAQPPERAGRLGMGGELPHLGGDRLPVVVGQLDAGLVGGHLQGGHADGAELAVGAGDRGDQGRLDQLVEPGCAHAGVAEDLLEVRVHRREVQQRLVDVEHLHTAHRDLLALPGPQ